MRSIRILGYAWRVFAKWLSFFIFGLGTLILVTVVFPPLRLIFHPRGRFQKKARALVSLCFRFFVWIMTTLGIVRLEAEDRLRYRNLSGKIVVANHPSLLDVVMLLALIPNGDCIVRGSLGKTIVRGVTRQLYIPNNANMETLLEDCKRSLEEGNCIIIFPEGTRTPRHEKGLYKKGAARVSLYSGCPVVPVRIGGNDKYGLGKGDPWTGVNPDDRYIYQVCMQNELFPGAYSNTPGGIRNFTAAIRQSILGFSSVHKNVRKNIVVKNEPPRRKPLPANQ
ncbi:MAG: 1-acyl-sn-glycerol-3-phosphate acyltransferase [Spirochaetaceae bacterium]|jgi:1-acyl-sn-glycerol-3-phosphate acyltransferase|nr:1-acyl-sn-glycerol-3-phosphate acyltransferase [Spirochaetaceae bacterium]